MGLATDVPVWLRRVHVDDVDERSEAIDELFSALCHQETVYPASAVAVPFIFEAAREAPLTASQRNLLLGLLVYIGRGADTCWEGYRSWETVAACQRAVAEFVPEIVAWSVGRGVEVRAWAIALAVYFPDRFEASKVPLAALSASMSETTLVAACSIASSLIAGTVPDEQARKAAAAVDADTLDYFTQGLDGFNADRRARLLVRDLPGPQCR